MRARAPGKTKVPAEAVITGVGVVVPCAVGTDQLQASLSRPPVYFPPEALEEGRRRNQIDARLLAAALPGEEEHFRRVDRTSILALAAANLALRESGASLDEVEDWRAGVVFGTAFGGLANNETYHRHLVESGLESASPLLFPYTVANAAAGEVSIRLGVRGPNICFTTGLISGHTAAGYALDQIRTGRLDLALVVAADTTGPALLEGLRRLVGPKALMGLTEGAAALVLESRAHAARRGRRPLARLTGYAAGFANAESRKSRTCWAVWTDVLRDAGVRAEEVDGVVLGPGRLRPPWPVPVPSGALFPYTWWVGECLGATPLIGVCAVAASLGGRWALPVVPGDRLGMEELSILCKRLNLVAIWGICYSGSVSALMVQAI